MYDDVQAALKIMNEQHLTDKEVREALAGQEYTSQQIEAMLGYFKSLAKPAKELTPTQPQKSKLQRLISPQETSRK